MSAGSSANGANIQQWGCNTSNQRLYCDTEESSRHVINACRLFFF
ncbi:hypothetical protein [Marinimicrobium sp. ARAG 43.8]